MRSGGPVILLSLSLAACGRPSTNGGSYTGIVTVVRANANGHIGFSATAMWLQSPFQYDAGAALRSDGRCVPVDLALESISAPTLDAGNLLTLTAPGGTSMVMDPLTADIRLYGASGAADLFVPDAEYSIDGVGGRDIGAINLKVLSSGDMRLLSPPVDGTATFSRSSGITLHWTSTGTKDPIVFEIDQTDTGLGTPVAAVRCSLPDSGTATLSGADFAALLLSSANPDLVTTFSATKVSLSEETIPRAGRTLIQAASRAEGMISIVE